MSLKTLGIVSIISLSATMFAPTAANASPAHESAHGEYVISIINHKFNPEELKVPAHKKIKLRIKNEDKTAEEFESHDLKREKIIPGGKEGVVWVGPLKPGTYTFFGEFNPASAQGKLIAE